MLLHNLTCGAWDVYESVFTTEPKVAERLPMPEGAPQIAAVTQAGPLVQSVRDCDDLQVTGGLQQWWRRCWLATVFVVGNAEHCSGATLVCWVPIHTHTAVLCWAVSCCRAVPCRCVAAAQTSMQFETVKTRQHVWMLLNSIDLQPESNPKCWVNRTVNYPTQIYGRAQAQPGSAASHELSLGFLRPAFQLPADAPARFFSVYNTSVRELPQGPDPRQAFTPGRWPPDIFTLLLWPVGRCVDVVVAVRECDYSPAQLMAAVKCSRADGCVLTIGSACLQLHCCLQHPFQTSCPLALITHTAAAHFPMLPPCRSTGEADPVFLQDVTFFVPQPEFDFFADRAAASSSFVVQLMGE